MSKKVYIDPGHGGKSPNGDVGAVGVYNGKVVYESTRNLAISLLIGDILEYQGIETRFSRTTDVFNSLARVCAEENEYRPNCCISLHMNSASPSAYGPMMLVHSQATPAIKEWANDILGNLYDLGIESNRAEPVMVGYMGSATANYMFNRETSSPSMIIEAGFITNEYDLDIHINRTVEYAEAICKGICKFLDVEYKQKPDPEETVKKIYRVQIGAFTNKDYAEAYVKEAKEAGFEAFIYEE